jgi:L-lysine 2,3-aminomutase
VSEALWRAQLAAVERSLFLLKDLSVTAEEMRQIARAPLRTPEDVQTAYYRYARLTQHSDGVREQLLACMDEIERRREQLGHH